MNQFLEARLHGRGGLGVVTSAELLARAAISEGKYAQSFPSFGPERRGAPVQAFLRISNEVIRIRTNVYDPDIVVVVDPLLLRSIDVTSGLKKNGKVIINSSKSVDEIQTKLGLKWTLAVVNASKIAQQTIGLPITNTAMIGAFLRVTNVLDISSIIEHMNERFGNRAQANIEAMQRAYEETIIGE